jgi:hypothetical protein
MKKGGNEEIKGRNVAFCLTVLGVCNRLIALLNKTTIAQISHSVVHEYVQKHV